MLNYYEILGVDHNASYKTIREQFRRKAKQIHPDVSRKSKQEAEEAMRLLLLAYRVLSNPQKRRSYDEEFQKKGFKKEFNYREFLKSHPDDLRLQSRLVFYDILNGKPEEALSLYERLTTQPGFKLEDYLEYGDFMDCLFLIAEEFEKQKQYLKAFRLFKKIYQFESNKPYFHHFVEEIIDRLRLIVTTKLQQFLKPEEMIELLEELLYINFPEKDKAIFCKKIAEIYSRQGNRALAQEYLRRGLCYDKKLPGTKKLSLKIGLA